MLIILLDNIIQVGKNFKPVFKLIQLTNYLYI
jgi:hypothetical protein